MTRRNGTLVLRLRDWLIAVFSLGSKLRERWRVTADSLFAAGSFGQRIIMVPSERIVIVHFGVTNIPNGDSDDFAHFVLLCPPGNGQVN